MSSTKFIDRRQLLTVTGAVSVGALASPAARAAGSNSGKAKIIKGVVMKRPEHKELTKEELLSGYGPPPGAPRPANPFGPPRVGTPAVLVEDGKYVPGSSKTTAVTAGKVGNASASGLRISSKEATVGGIYTKGLDTEYTVADAVIDLSGDGPPGLGGPDAGAAAYDYSTLILRNCVISTHGANRNASCAQNHSILKVYNSTLTAYGAPFTVNKTDTAQKRDLEIDGTSRAHVTQANSYSYFYYSDIIAEGWAALSMDIVEGFAYLEANYCKVKTLKAGYGTYADFGCHNHINNCDFDVADMAGIISGQADMTFKDTRAKCGSYFVLVHNVGPPREVSTLTVIGGDVTCKSAGIRFKSANVDVLLDGVRIVSESGRLMESVTADDPAAARSANTKGMQVYGIHATLRNMAVAGDIVHTEEKDYRTMTVYLETTTLTGVVQDAAISLDPSSKWVATANSNVTLIGDLDVNQIDAPAGVTITAIAAESGAYRLAGSGTLVLKTA